MIIKLSPSNFDPTIDFCCPSKHSHVHFYICNIYVYHIIYIYAFMHIFKTPDWGKGGQAGVGQVWDSSSLSISPLPPATMCILGGGSCALLLCRWEAGLTSISVYHLSLSLSLQIEHCEHFFFYIFVLLFVFCLHTLFPFIDYFDKWHFWECQKKEKDGTKMEKKKDQDWQACVDVFGSVYVSHSRLCVCV